MPSLNKTGRHRVGIILVTLILTGFIMLLNGLFFLNSASQGLKKNQITKNDEGDGTSDIEHDYDSMIG